MAQPVHGAVQSYLRTMLGNVMTSCGVAAALHHGHHHSADAEDSMQPSYLLLVALLNVIIPPVVTVGTNEEDNTEQEQHLGEWQQHSSRHRTNVVRLQVLPTGCVRAAHCMSLEFFAGSWLLHVSDACLFTSCTCGQLHTKPLC